MRARRSPGAHDDAARAERSHGVRRCRLTDGLHDAVDPGGETLAGFEHLVSTEMKARSLPSSSAPPVTQTVIPAGPAEWISAVETSSGTWTSIRWPGRSPD